MDQIDGRDERQQFRPTVGVTKGLGEAICDTDTTTADQKQLRTAEAAAMCSTDSTDTTNDDTRRY